MRDLFKENAQYLLRQLSLSCSAMFKFNELSSKQSLRDAENWGLVLFLWAICECVGLH
jgi:predicted membrane protein